MTTQADAERFGKFVVVQPLRRGGMGAPAVAVDTEAGRIVVVKRLRKLSAESLERFQDEVKISRALGDHPNLAKAIDAGAIDGQEFLVLEWAQGPDVEQLLERAGRYGKKLPLSVSVAIASDVLGALEYAHGRGLAFVHRDVKPANVVVTYDGGVKLLDYGGALSVYKNAKTDAGQAFGSVGYWAPEQREGQPATERSDLYSVGAVIWFSLTGMPRFGEGEDGNSKAVMAAELAQQAGELPPAIVTAIWRALQRNPKNRYASAAEMRQALQAATASAPAAEVGAFVSSLFPVEKKRAIEETAEWLARYGRETPKTATMRAAAWTPINKDASTNSQRSIAHRLGLILTVAAATIALGSASWLLVRPKHSVREPIAQTPIAAPTEPPPVHVEPIPPPALPAPTHQATSAVTHSKPVAHSVTEVAPLPTQPPLAPLLKRIHDARELASEGKTVSARAILDELDGEQRLQAPVKIALADLAYREGSYDKAISLASEAAKAGGGIEATSLRAQAELRAGRNADAERDFAQVLEKDPDNEDAREGQRMAQQYLRTNHP